MTRRQVESLAWQMYIKDQLGSWAKLDPGQQAIYLDAAANYISSQRQLTQVEQKAWEIYLVETGNPSGYLHWDRIHNAELRVSYLQKAELLTRQTHALNHAS